MTNIFENKGFIMFMAWFSLIATIANIAHLIRDGLNSSTGYVLALLVITSYSTGYYFNELYNLKQK